VIPMTVTKPRTLHAVPDDATPVIHTTIVPRGRHAALTGERQEALAAMQAPEVVEEQAAAISTALRRLATHTLDRPTALAKLAEAMFTLGYVNGAADQRQTGHLKLIDGALTAIDALETAERDQARQAEAALNAKAKGATTCS
jgi:hypothetical protein